MLSCDCHLYNAWFLVPEEEPGEKLHHQVVGHSVAAVCNEGQCHVLNILLLKGCVCGSVQLERMPRPLSNLLYVHMV